MRFICTLACLAVALTATFGAPTTKGPFDGFKNFFNFADKYDATIDYVHNYRFEDHVNQIGPHLLIAISDSSVDKSCHVIEVDSKWESYLKDSSIVHIITDEIYNLIKSHHAQETTKTLRELFRHYGDTETMKECFRHTVYEMSYTPSMAPTAKTTV